MIRILILFLALCTAAACLPKQSAESVDQNPPSEGYVFDDESSDPGAADADPEIEEVAQTPEPEASAEPEPTKQVDLSTEKPDPNAAARLACAKRKGSFAKTKSGAFTCLDPTGEDRKSCTSGRQCKGHCLARSGTCAPFVPLLGCHEVFTAGGGRATVCID